MFDILIVCESRRLSSSGTYYDDYPTTKQKILKQVSDYFDEVMAGLQKMEKTAKPKLIESLKKVIDIFGKVETKLKEVKPTTDIEKTILSGIESIKNEVLLFVEQELKKVQSSPQYYDNLLKVLLATHKWPTS